MKLRVVFNGSVPKEDGLAATNDDSVMADEERQRFVVTDGASESYDPGRWSRLVAKNWIDAEPKKVRVMLRDGLRSSIRQYELECDRVNLSWSKQGAYSRGSYSTLLGVSLEGDHVLVVAIGDSIVDGHPIDSAIRRFPDYSPEDFNRRPLLISTKHEMNLNLSRPRPFDGLVARWRLEVGCTLLLMTDAIGRWLVKQPVTTDARGQLTAFRTQDDFAAFVDAARESGEMKRDDTTLLHLRAESS